MQSCCLMVMELQLGLGKMKTFWRWTVVTVCNNVNVFHATELYT